MKLSGIACSGCTRIGGLRDWLLRERRLNLRNSADWRADKDSGRCRNKQGQRRFTQPTLAGGGH